MTRFKCGNVVKVVIKSNQKPKMQVVHLLTLLLLFVFYLDISFWSLIMYSLNGHNTTCNIYMFLSMAVILFLVSRIVK